MAHCACSMAFFGLTHLGSQTPIRDKLIMDFQRETHCHDGFSITHSDQPPLGQHQLNSSSCSDRTKGHTQKLPYSNNIHHGSHKKYKEMVKRIQTPRSPNQLYVMPITESQQYGWLASETPEPWTRVKRFPRKESEMSKFVSHMSMTDPEFSLF